MKGNEILKIVCYRMIRTWLTMNLYHSIYLSQICPSVFLTQSHYDCQKSLNDLFNSSLLEWQVNVPKAIGTTADYGSDG